ncbi:MAG: hypothetical protein IJA89_05530 [Clostridia bacterium]|nr:hypothetical protein [Clostridia bacterium]
MKRNWYKKVALLTAVLTLGSVVMATGCKGDDEEVEIDESKTQLYVANLDVGIGRTWVETLSKKFEDAFAGYSFEEGKTGVQVIINHDTSYAGEFVEKSQTDANYIFFTESVDYAMYSKYMADVSDVMEQGAITGVDASGNFIRESKPIAEKIDGDFLEYLNVANTSEPALYRAMPYYLGMRVVNYDIDLWSDKQFYFAKGCAPSEIVVQAIENETDLPTAIAAYETEIGKLKAGESSDYWAFVDKNGTFKSGATTLQLGLSAGPDGKYDTFDDGLPATYDEFYLLCDKMAANNVTPFIWAGSSPNYAENLTRSLFQNDAGVDTLKTYYSLEGKVDNLVKFDGNSVVVQNGKPVLESYTFTGGEEDGYNVFRLENLYNALQFVEKVVRNDSWTSLSCYDETSMVDAQAKYLTTGNTAGGNRIAMLLDGSWWQQEATSTFEIMEKKDSKYAKVNRNFSVLPLPDSTIERHIKRIENDEKMTFVTANDSYMYVNGKLKEGSVEMEVTKAFLSFISNDDNILTFMETTNMLRPLTPDYDAVDQDRYNELSAYSKRLIELQQNANVVYPYSEKAFAQNNSSIWDNFVSFPNASIGQHNYPMQAMRNNQDKGLNAKLYFEGVYKYFKDTKWATLNR